MADLTPGISAILIVYHEEAIIERCLQSLAGVVDEIILIHDGDCHDSTLSIARKYTDKIYIHPHTGESEVHKIKALDYASHSWILKIDADEFLSDELRSGLRALIEDDRCDSYAFIWPIWNGAKYISKGVPYKDVLFRKENIYAVEFPHTTYSVNGVRKRVPLLFEHRPRYNNFTWETFQRKWVRWITDQADATCQHRDARFYNCTPEQIEAFHRRMEKQIRFAHPFTVPAWFLLSFGKFFFRLKAWTCVALLKVTSLEAMYAARLCYEIWRRKKHRLAGA